jgi:hypothetical protein
MLMRRIAVVFAVALAPLSIATITTPAANSAVCEPGSWWDPVEYVCRPTVVEPLPCDEGWWWDPYVNICRPPMVGAPPIACLNSWWWDPTIKRCRPPPIPWQ